MQVWYKKGFGQWPTKQPDPKTIMHTQDDREHHPPAGHEIFLFGVIWAFVGALYAALFMPVFEVVRHVWPLWTAPICAAVVATAGGALVYSSSQLAMLVAIFSNFAVFGYLLYSGAFASPLAPTVIGAAIGALVGALYGLGVKESRIYSAEAKLLAGLIVGFAVSIVSLVWILVFDASLPILAAVLAPLTGLLYVKVVDGFIKRFSDIFPAFLDGAIAGAVIGGFIGFGLWVMGGIVLQKTAPEWEVTIAIIGETTPIAVAAASVSTGILGTLYGALRSRF